MHSTPLTPLPIKSPVNVAVLKLGCLKRPGHMDGTANADSGAWQSVQAEQTNELHVFSDHMPVQMAVSCD